MKVLTVSPRGFCAGVHRAIEVVDLALEKFGAPIYVRKEIVHNQAVVKKFKEKGVIFVDEVEDVPQNNTLIFSAHGISPEVRKQAKEKNLKTIDATCPLVTKVHLEVHRFTREKYSILLIGHRNHDEVVGTMGEAPGKITLVERPEDVANLKLPDEEKIMVLTQTTLSVDETQATLLAIKKRFPNAHTPPKDDICYATQNRQDAVKNLVTEHGIDVLLVVGSQNSSNSQRLCEVARERGVKAHLIDQAAEIQPEWVKDADKVGITAGASAPEYLVQDAVKFLENNFGAQVEHVFVREENVTFSLPKELTKAVATIG